MIRTQVSLSEEQAERLRAQAVARGMSQAALLRQALDAYLDKSSLRLRRARSRLGAYRSGCATTAGSHDDALDEAFSA